MGRYFVPFLLFLGTLFFGYLYIQEPGDSMNARQKRSQGSIRYNQVQQLQQETAIKMDISKQQAQIDKRVGGPDLNPGQRKKNSFHKTELRKELDPRVIDLQDSSTYQAMTLDQRMDEFLAKKQYYEDLEQSQKQAYVKEFIKEAYKMGFKVVVNDKMEIESVEKINPN